MRRKGTREDITKWELIERNLNENERSIGVRAKGKKRGEVLWERGNERLTHCGGNMAKGGERRWKVEREWEADLWHNSGEKGETLEGGKPM